MILSGQFVVYFIYISNHCVSSVLLSTWKMNWLNFELSSPGRGGRGRGRGSYQTEALRGRFGARSLGRGSNQDSGDYNRVRGNDFSIS
jgi:hypothetical protein